MCAAVCLYVSSRGGNIPGLLVERASEVLNAIKNISISHEVGLWAYHSPTRHLRNGDDRSRKHCFYSQLFQRSDSELNNMRIITDI